MAPSIVMASLPRRYDGCPADYYRSGSYCYPNSSWYWWGRWVLAGIIVVFALVMMVGCVVARRRKRRGMAPMYGTGWMGGKNGTPMQNNQGAYNTNYQYQYAPPPPQYTPNNMDHQTTGTTFSPNDGYYGTQNGTYVQPPQNTYAPNRAAPPVYEPPPGPPPAGKAS